MIYLRLFFEFFKTGLFAVGGGLATLPFLYSMSAATGWFSESDITNLLAISESTPGPLGINMATYVGFITAGVLGGVIASLGLLLPSFLIVIVISKMLTKFKKATIVDHIFYSLRPASTALIAAAGLGVAKIAFLQLDLFTTSPSFLHLFNLKGILLGIVLWFGLKKFKWHPIVYIVIAAIVGVLFQFEG